MNAVEKDHVLLIDLSSISSYYLTKWKNEVLINGGNSIDELKKVQMVVFINVWDKNSIEFVILIWI